MAKILVVSGHPHLDKSLANRTILETLKGLGPDFTLHRLDETGWDFDVKKEQELLKDADVIVFQFPIQWYSYPALMKHWVEDVFAHGFAYGTGGTALKGKKFQLPSPPAAPPALTAWAVPTTILLKIFSTISSRLQPSAVWNMRNPFIPWAVPTSPA